MEKRDKLYEGKAKIVYATDDPGKVIQYFKDDATAFNALKRGTIVGKGVINNKMSAALFQRLAKAGVPTHYLATLSDREMLCRKLDIIMVEVIPRNMVAGTLAKRTGLEEGVAIKPPIVELFYKSDPLGDPMITEEHVRMLRLASPKEVAWLKRTALKIPDVGRELGARYVLEGSVRKVGEQARITAQLVDAVTGHGLWAERYDRDLKDIFGVQDEISQKIAMALKVNLTTEDEASGAP